MESLFGGLFGFESKESLENFVENVDKVNAIKMIELSLLYIQKNGFFSFEESHIIYKCLNKLKENEDPNISNYNPNGDSVD